MKRFLFLLGLLSLAALASCNIKEELPTEERIFRGVMEQLVPEATSKAYATEKESGSYDIFWNRDDRVSIFYDKTYNREYRVTDRDGSQAATFERVGTDPDHISENPIDTGYDYAIYPYHIDNRCDTKGTLTVVIPENQEYYNDARGVGVRPIMAAQDPDGDFMFKHAATYVGVTLKGEGVSVKSISFQGNNSELLAGYPLLTFDEEGTPIFSFDPNDLDNSSVVTMTLAEPVALDAEEEKTFWLSLVPVTLSKGYTITVKDQNGGTFQKVTSKSATLERRFFYKSRATVEITSVTTYSLAITPAEKKEINVGETQAYTLTLITTTDGVDSESTVIDNVTWTSSDNAIATIANGTATGVKEGEVTITATYTPEGSSEALTATASLKVNKDPNHAGDPTPIDPNGKF